MRSMLDIDLEPEPKKGVGSSSQPTPVGKTKTEECILATISRRATLLQTIADSDHAAAELSALQKLFIPMYEKSKVMGETRSQMKKAEDQKYEEWKRLEGSHTRKLFNKSKWQEEVYKAENEYLEAKVLYGKADAPWQCLEDDIKAKVDKKKALQGLVEERGRAQYKLEELYNVVFSGETPENPEDDKLEEEMRAAQEIVNELQTQCAYRSSIVGQLSMSRNSLWSAIKNTRSANSFNGAERRGHLQGQDARERRELAWAQRSTVEAEHFFSLAQEADPDVGPYFDLKPPTRTVGDLAFSAEMSDAEKSLRMTQNTVQAELKKAEERLAPVQRERNRAGEVLKDVRNRLWELREKLFIEIMNQDNLADLPECPPPSYSKE